MILYFTGTGNSLAVAKRIAEATGENIMPLAQAAGKDLGCERVVGLVYPCYDFNTPPAVRHLVGRLRLNREAYVFIVVTCGAQTGNSVWTVQQILKRQGVRVAYCHKIRMPDNSAAIFGRNPNDQLWKLDKFAPRLERIVADIQAHRRGNHFGSPGLMGWVMGRPAVERKILGSFRPAVIPDLCVGCGICATVCPIGNIILDGNGKATIGDHCTNCIGCLHACPQLAIGVGATSVPKERQYRHPDIKVADLQA